MGYRSEIPSTWKRWWLAMWAVIFVGLVAAAPVLSFGEWVVAATLAFGLPEGFAILRHKDAYPPLTHVTRHFLPRWLTFTVIYGVFGAVGSYWLGFAHPLRFGALFALLGWLTSHFDVVYEE